MTLPRRAYIAAFALGCIAVGGGIGLGLWQSLSADRRLPPVNISNIAEIQQLLDAGEYEDAISRLGMSLELIPQNHHVLLNMRGNALNTLGRHAEAIDDFERAIAIEPGFVQAYNNLGIAYIGVDDLQSAVARFNDALHVDPGFDVARQNLQRALADYEASLATTKPSDEDRRILDDARVTLSGGTSTPSATPAAPLVVASDDLLQARLFAERFLDGDLEWLHDSFTEGFRGRMSLTNLSRFRSQVGEQLGVENDLLGDRMDDPDADGMRTYKRWSRFNRFPGVVELSFDLSSDWQVDDLRMRLSDTEPEALR